MQDNELISLLKAPLGLTSCAMISKLSGGTINRCYYVKDNNKEFMIKYFEGDDSLSIDRKECFDLQLELFEKGMAAKPLYLSFEQDIYAEQWIKLDRSHVLLSIENEHIDAMAKALSRIHCTVVSAKEINLPKDWQHYLRSSPSPSNLLIERVKKATEEWIIYKEEATNSQVFCHNDLSWGHLCLPTKLILDWEYAGLGNRYFDILSCARINKLNPQQHERLLAQYAKLNELLIETVYEGCSKQADFLELTYQLWQQALGVNSKI